jgi:hypothetical protein
MRLLLDNLLRRWREWRDDYEFTVARKRAAWHIPKGPK